jgi:hypothetical protein
MVRDNLKNRAKVAEVIKSYSEKKETRKFLNGLRIIPVPDGFDADNEDERIWMYQYIRQSMLSDLLFGVVFAKLTGFDVVTFSNHGGPIGLKFKALQVLNSNGRDHGPTFETQVGYKGPPLREVITMLAATGLVRQGRSTTIVPSLKGRFFLDLCKRIMFEKLALSDWSEEMKLIFAHLDIKTPNIDEQYDLKNQKHHAASEIVYSMKACESQFGMDLMADVNMDDPCFYSMFDWERFRLMEEYLDR